jgi:hypothetical protein
VVRLTDDALFNCPWIEMEDVGVMRLSDAEVKRLHEYLVKGGFLYVDDFWGEWAWDQWAEEIGRVLDPKKYPIFDIPLSHPLFRTMFVVPKLPQIPSINHWMRTGGGTSERGEKRDSHPRHRRRARPPHGRHDARHGYLDAGARGRGSEHFCQFSPDGYAVGINVVVYALTH